MNLRNGIAFALLFLFVSGCASPGGVNPSPVDPPAESQPQPARTAPPAASQAPTTVAGWNDLAYARIQEQRWSEAIEAAQQAIALDKESAAAHFNLGRAYLGAGKAEEAVRAFDTASRLTKEANADVAFFRGQALVAARQEQTAIAVWAAALEGPLAGDKEIAAALKALLQKHDAPVEVGDVDLDGTLDLLRVEGDRFRITTGSGRRLYDAEITPSALTDSSHRIRLYLLSGEPPLIHVETPACPSAPLNRLFWFDPQAKEVRQLANGEGPCTVFRYVDDHLLENGMRAGGIYLINRLRFEAGDFKQVGRKADLIWLPKADSVGYYLTTFTTWPLEEPERLFLSMETYDQFLVKTREGSWTFEQAGPPAADSVQLKAFRDGQEVGLITVTLQPAGEDRVKIARIRWP